MIQATTRGQVLDGVQRYGVAPGARKMMDWEDQAASAAIDTGLYVTWRNSRGQDCTRVGSDSKCFCGHLYKDHSFSTKKSVYPRCNSCNCQAFAFIPRRPEEVGDWWLPRRKGFNVHTWRAKCRCGHGHDEHDPVYKRCSCGCPMFNSNFACVACDLKWEDHETVFESTMERMAAGKPVGDEFRPLADDSQLQELVFPKDKSRAEDSFAPNRLRRAQVPAEQGEKSVKIMAASSGGAIRDQDVANRYGRVVNPPPELLYNPFGTPAPAAIASPRASAGPARSGSASRARPGSSSSSGFGVGSGGSSGPARPSSASRTRPVPGMMRPAAVGNTRTTAGSSVLSVRGVSTSLAGAGSNSRSPQGAGPAASSGSGPKPTSSGFRPVYD